MSVSAIIVLYRQRLEDCPAFQSLRAGAASGELSELFVWDNSPEPAPRDTSVTFPTPVRFHHDPTNSGLVSAYDWAWKLARSAGTEWLLLLDQDAALPADYLETFARLAPSFPGDVHAAVPHVEVRGRPITPEHVVLGLVGVRQVASDWSGVADDEIAAINSGTFVRVAHLAERDGFSHLFTLDMVDYLFFAELYAGGGKAFVLPVTLAHDLSTASPATLSMERWQQITHCRALYYAQTRTRPEQLLAAAWVGYGSLPHLRRGRVKMATINALGAVRMFRTALFGR